MVHKQYGLGLLSPPRYTSGLFAVGLIVMSYKNFKLSPNQIKPMAMGYGSCFASDRITVDGCPVGYCYREESDHDTDSGWRFFAGDESQEYADNPDNFAIYDINTIANYDSAITEILDASKGSVFERGTTGQLIPVSENEP